MGTKLSDKSAMTTWAAADQIHVLASGVDYRMTLEDLFTEIVSSPAVKNSDGIDIDTTTGADGDVDLITCLVTGTPKLWWDESEDSFVFTKPVKLPTYERHVQLTAKADGTVGNQPTQVDFFTCGGLQYPTTGSKNAFTQWEVPNDWDGGDVYFEVDWFPDSGNMSGTDTVEWHIEYRSIAEGEPINNGTSVTLTVTDSNDYLRYVTKHARVTLPFNHADQPLAKQDHVYFRVTRNTSVANDFGGSVTVPAYEIIYNSVGTPTSN